MATNKDKIKKYKEVSKVIFNQYYFTHYKHHPILIWYTISDLRSGKLKESCETVGLRYRIYGNM
ncbi:hypothetical protein GCM10007111_03850 [Virgibacillus kapii]|uniref:Uncharacterized protein n=1 Tax=Virgibacillus kapii TaxID=1638645 RepID=A0ABQ2D4W0_9BACI|nr:hypothetical protein GCM10007111_03850 [Virgibacillus kapii]